MINEVWIDEENQELRQRLIDDAILTEAPEYFAEVKRLMDTLPRRYAIVDMDQADARKILNREAREHIVKYSTPVDYEKLAYINFSHSLRMIAKVINRLAANRYEDETEIGFFKTEEEAVAWLKGGSKK